MIDFWLWYAFGDQGHLREADYLANSHTSSEAKLSKFAKYVSSDLLDAKYVSSSYEPTDTKSGNDETWKNSKEIFLDPYFAPLMAENLDGLPETFIATAEWDILRDDGLMYVKRLSKSGVRVETKNYERGFHHLLISINHFSVSQSALNDLVDFLARKL